MVGMSALLTTTRENMRATIEALRENDLKNKIIVGGPAAHRPGHGHGRMDAVLPGFIEEADAITERPLGLPTTTGLHSRAGSFSRSTKTKKVFMSTWAMTGIKFRVPSFEFQVPRRQRSGRPELDEG